PVRKARTGGGRMGGKDIPPTPSLEREGEQTGPPPPPRGGVGGGVVALLIASRSVSCFGGFCETGLPPRRRTSAYRWTTSTTCFASRYGPSSSSRSSSGSPVTGARFRPRPSTS